MIVFMERNRIMANNGFKMTAHIHGLDGLRTLAIAGVTLFHLLPHVFVGGYLGVSLFFVLTGYLLAYTCERNCKNNKFSIIAYYRKRIARIYPSLLLVILVTIGTYSFFAPKVITAIRAEVMSVLLGYNNWWQIAQNSDYFTRLTNQSPFTHLWFLGIELQYYFVWPLYFILYIGIAHLYGKRMGIAVTAFFGFVASLFMPFMYQPDMDVTRLYYGTDTRVYALLLGAAMGLYHANFTFKMRWHRWLKPFKYGLFLVLTVITVVSYLMMDGQNPLTYQGGMLVMTLGFCVMLALTTDRDLYIGQVFELPVFRWIGKKSYGIFLWQYPVIYLFQYMKWDAETTCFGVELPTLLPYIMPVVEVGVIVILTIWSDTLLGCLSTLRGLSLKHRRIIVHICLIFLISMPGFAMMGYGCKGIVESAEYKAADTNELKSRLEQNEVALRTQQTNKNAQPIPAQDIDIRGIACIGDSVMLGSAMALKEVLPDCYIDAQVSRYVGAGLEVAQEMEAQGRLGDVVLIALGTNGPLDGQYEEQTKALLAYLGPKRHIFWVNVYCPSTGWQESNNSYLEKIKEEHANVIIIDWYSLISKHQDWLTDDGIHPDTIGTKEYAKLIHDTIADTLQKNV